MVILYVLLFLGGMFSGVVNVLAGGGSFITLPILSLFGLSPSVANGTNRIAILLQNVSAASSFARRGVLDIRDAGRLSIPTVIGAVLGTTIAIRIPERLLQMSLGVIFLVMAVYILFGRDNKAGSTRLSHGRMFSIVEILVFFLIGVYGGYIQAGVGFFLVAALMKLRGMDIKSANVFKIFLTLLFTIVSLLLFSVGKKVEFVPGTVLGIGSFVGGLLGARLNMVLGRSVIKYILIGMMIFSALMYLF